MVDQAEIHRMASSKDAEGRMKAAEKLSDNLVDLPDKEQAWRDLIRLTSDTDNRVVWRAAETLGRAFEYVSEKKQAWNDLHGLTLNTDCFMRRSVVDTLGSSFAKVPDKKQGWYDLIRLTSDSDSSVRWRAAEALGNVFVYVPDKKQAWDELIKVTSDIDSSVSWRAAESLDKAFAYVPNKKQAWDDLKRLISGTSIGLHAAYALGNAFAYMPDKQQAWNDLHSLTSCTQSPIRQRAVYALGRAFANLPDKKKAWDDLIRLIFDTDFDVRRDAADALGKAFAQMSDKKQAWLDLHKLASDTHSNVRRAATETLGSVFAHVPDKKQAWDDIHKHTSDEDRYVRASAYHSLGKASIFKAANAENDIGLKEEMEKAIEYFEQSSKQETYSKPAEFCLPFYRSFYTLTFMKEKTEEEVEKYIEEAKNAVKGSESRNKLLEAVENLGNALKEVQKARDFKDLKSDLNAYRRYCDRACELLDTTEAKAPGASRLIRKGLPIIDERIKGIISEIREKAKALCKNTQDTPLEKLGKDVNRAGQCLALIRDPISLEKRVQNMQTALSAICARMPVEERGDACELLRKANDEQYVEDKLELINMVLSKIPYHIGNLTNIQISNSNNIQITTANGTTQKMSIEIPEEKTEK